MNIKMDPDGFFPPNSSGGTDIEKEAASNGPVQETDEAFPAAMGEALPPARNFIKETNTANFTVDVIETSNNVPVVVDFWATWCIPCLKSFGHTVEWQSKYGKQGLAVVSMSMDDAEDKARAIKFLNKKNARIVNLMSWDGVEEDAVKAFDIDGGALPHFKIYDRNGKLIRKFGFKPGKPVKHEDVEAAIKEALAGS